MVLGFLGILHSAINCFILPAIHEEVRTHSFGPNAWRDTCEAALALPTATGDPIVGWWW